MDLPNLRTVLAAAASRWRLLDHRYYQRWQAGTLARDDLAVYASQYRHVERALPRLLATTAQQLAVGPVRALVEQNLDDERSRPRPHTELFEAFASEVGARDDPPAPATRRLVDIYDGAAQAGPIAALSTIGAYEVQAAEIARTKADTLRHKYALDDAATEFWDVHADLEDDHAGWTSNALTLLDASPKEVTGLASESARAWWEFLDEQAAMAG